MALVDYSGSDSSDEEEKPSVKGPTKPKDISNKSTFQKVVDSSDPHKIRISLPEPSKSDADGDAIERSSKRVKLGSGGLSGFNALLPAPKRAAASNLTASSNGLRKGGLGSGVNLKTGATPGFSRDIETSRDELAANEVGDSVLNSSTLAENQNTIEISNSEGAIQSKENQVESSKPQGKPSGKPSMFKPLSVARKPPKKKIVPPAGSSDLKRQDAISPQESKPAPKVSLFSVIESDGRPQNGVTRAETYQPLVYKNENPISKSSALDISQQDQEDFVDDNAPNNPKPTGSQSLDTIASDLNLSASAKRQLFGRQKNNPIAVNIVNFNTDEEYKANEEARQGGEQVQHNPVRSIAPGKHSLKQLVNMGTMQADALEESFASGRRNRSEAGSKYGW